MTPLHVGIASVSAVIPLVTVTYERNYPAHQRGKRVGVGMALKVAVSALAGLAMGAWLDGHLGRWWVILLAGAAMLGLMAWLQGFLPSAPLDRVAGVRNRPWPHFHLIGEDRKLRLTLGAADPAARSWTALLNVAAIALFALMLLRAARRWHQIHGDPSTTP